MESFDDHESADRLFDDTQALLGFSTTWLPSQLAGTSELALFKSSQDPFIHEATDNGTASFEAQSSIFLQPEMQPVHGILSAPQADTEALAAQSVIVRPDGPNDPVWERYKDTIVSLYWDEERSLSVIMRIMKDEYNFFASEKQYKIQLGPKFWNLGKNLKTREAETMIQIQHRRQIEDGKSTAFRLRKRPVPPEKILRFTKRRKISISKEIVLAESVPTPSDISYYTPDEETASEVSDDQATPKASPALKPRQPSEDSHFNAIQFDQIGMESLELRTPPCLPDTVPSPDGNIQSWIRNAIRSPLNHYQPQTPNSDFFNYHPDEFSFLAQAPDIMDQIDRLTEAVARTQLQDPGLQAQTGAPRRSTPTPSSESAAHENSATKSSEMVAPVVATGNDVSAPGASMRQTSRFEVGITKSDPIICVEPPSQIDVAGVSGAMRNESESYHDHVKDKAQIGPIRPPTAHLLTDCGHGSSHGLDRSQTTHVPLGDEPLDLGDSDELAEIPSPSPEHSSPQPDDEIVVLSDSSSFERAITGFKNQGFLFQQGEALNRQLRFASKTGDILLVRALLERGAVIDSPSANGMTALHLAAYMGYASVVNELIKKGASQSPVQKPMVFRLGGYNQTISEPCLLHLAALRGHTKTTEVVIRRGYYNAEVVAGDRHFSMIRWAVKYDNKQLVSLLLENGMDPNLEIWSTAAKSLVPLITYAVSNHSGEVMHCLLDAGAMVKLPCSVASPLLAAVKEGDETTVGLLLRAGADVNGDYGFGETIIHHAVRAQNLRIVELLLGTGPNVEIRDINGNTALDLAIDFNRAGLRSKMQPESLDIIRLILKHGAHVNYADPRTGDTPLHRAVVAGDVEKIDILLSNGAHANYENSETGDTPLHRAVAARNASVVGILLSKGAHVNYANSKTGETPLHRAVMADDVIMVNILLSNGADILCCRTEGRCCISCFFFATR